MKSVMYRYDADYFGFDPKIKIKLCEYLVHKETPCGKWVHKVGLPPTKQCLHFVLNNSHKRYAHEDKGKALESFIIRKEHEIDILKEKLKNAKEAMSLAKALPKK